MKYFLIISFLLVNLFSDSYIIDNEKSEIRFVAKKFIFVGVDGEFKKFSGNIEVEGNQLKEISGAVNIASIFTDNKERDDHLIADDYFYVSEYPMINIKTVSIESNTLIANVSIKGISKDIKFTIDSFNIDNKTVKISLSSIINRQDFMLNGSMSAIMSDNVKISATIVSKKE